MEHSREARLGQSHDTLNGVLVLWCMYGVLGTRIHTSTTYGVLVRVRVLVVHRN
jgi:hypothetical protein